MKFFDLLKEVYHIGQCNPNDVDFEKLREWYGNWKGSPEWILFMSKLIDVVDDSRSELNYIDPYKRH